MQSRHRSWVKAVALVAAAVVQVAACGGGNSPQDSSATHFLRACTGSCPGSLECVCGVCTKPCAGNGACNSLSSAATCTTPSGADGLECTAEVANVCDVECTTSAQCRALPVGFECVSGRCRHTGDPGGGRDAGAVDASSDDARAPSTDAPVGVPDATPVADASADAPSPSPESGVDAGHRPPDSGVDAAPPGPATFAKRLDTLGGQIFGLAVDRQSGSSYVLTDVRGSIDLGAGPIAGGPMRSSS